MTKYAPYVGMQRGHLTVLEVGLREAPTGQLLAGGYQGHRTVRCRCKCGQETYIRPPSLFNGIMPSCGHCGDAKPKPEPTIYDRRSTHYLYNTHHNMMARCYNPQHHKYPRYGARGIYVVEEWHDPLVYCAWMDEHLGHRPEGHTQDRIDNDGPYAPWNVRWADYTTQNNNVRKGGFYLAAISTAPASPDLSATGP